MIINVGVLNNYRARLNMHLGWQQAELNKKALHLFALALVKAPCVGVAPVTESAEPTSVVTVTVQVLYFWVALSLQKIV